jgi:molybdate transport system ATP-binding protein
VSPELHLYFKNTGKCLSVVGSGLLDTLGLFKPLTEEQKHRSMLWLSVLGINHLADKEFYKISQGEQRMVLLARALVKNPPLLILDEPCQGLDVGQIEHIKKVLNYLVEHSDTTLIYVSHYVSDIPSCVKQTKELTLVPANLQPIG